MRVRRNLNANKILTEIKSCDDGFAGSKIAALLTLGISMGTLSGVALQSFCVHLVDRLPMYLMLNIEAGGQCSPYNILLLDSTVDREI